jgi:hypothetical protein
MIIKNRVIKDVPEDMELKNVMQQLNSDNQTTISYTFPGHWRSQT